MAWGRHPPVFRPFRCLFRRGPGRRLQRPATPSALWRWALSPSAHRDAPGQPSQPGPPPLNSLLCLFPATLFLPVPRNSSPARSTSFPTPPLSPPHRTSRRATAPPSGRSLRQVPRCTHCPEALTMGAPHCPGFGAPTAGPRPYPEASCGHRGPGWAQAPRRVFWASRGQVAAGKRGGGKEGAGAVWAVGVFPALHRRAGGGEV